jgi:hypothetical protein
MRLDTKLSKQDRYPLEPTSARALTEGCAPRYTNKLNVPLDIADVVRDVETSRLNGRNGLIAPVIICPWVTVPSSTMAIPCKCACFAVQ